MPRCSKCGQTRSRDGFSRSQLKKPERSRRCTSCTESNGTANSTTPQPQTQRQTQRQTIQQQTPSRAAPPSIQFLPEPSDHLFRTLAAKLLAPNRIHGVPERLRQPDTLHRYLEDTLDAGNPDLRFLTYPLIEALLERLPDVNGIINFSNKPFTILILVCQWKLWQRFGWRGSNDIVSMVLAIPGLNVNRILDNFCNAAFFTVKYGDIETLELLIKAGINMQQRDNLGQTVFFNALEYPRPSILRRVLEFVAVDESFVSLLEDGSGVITQSAADKILNLYASSVVCEGRVVRTHLSWINLGGPPPVEDVAECLMMVRQKGASFTEGSEIGWFSLGYVLRGGTESVADSDHLKRLGMSIFGFLLPPSALSAIERWEEEAKGDGRTANPPQGDCSICLNPYENPIDLYCGCRFCVRCIVRYGQGNERFCPKCRRLLCRDVHVGAEEGLAVVLENDGNIASDFSVKEAVQFTNLSSLSDAQVTAEARVQGFYSREASLDALRTELVKRTEDAHTNAAKSQPISTTAAQEPYMGTTVVELASNIGMFTANHIVTAPQDGAALVEIVIKGVPVAAFISNNSRYTIVSSTLVQAFKLKKVAQLTSRKFRDGLTGRKIKKNRFTCLDKLEFTIGGIGVTLRNAIESDPDMDGVGIQLGQDFFLSAAYCVVDTFINSDALALSSGEEEDIDMRRDGIASLQSSVDLYMRTVGIASWPVLRSREPNLKESIRYYSHNGKTASLPLLHVNAERGKINVLALKPDVAFTECNWCCRTFPVGMLGCSACLKAGEDAYYCGVDCQTASWEVHKESRCKQRK